jgi:Flp pilus assembly protein TadD
MRWGILVGLGLGLASCSRFVLLGDALSAAEHNDLGVAYEAAGETELARREYRRALRRSPHLARARVNLGNLEAAAGRWKRAEHLYRRALRDDPGDPDARNNLAVSLLHQDRRSEEAEWMARSAVALSQPRDSIARATLADVLEWRARRRGRPAGAAPR